MFELTQVDGIENYSKNEFRSFVNEFITEKYGGERLDCCILYNCTSFIKGKQIRRLGFKKVYKYSGNSDYDLVSVYLLELNRTSFLNRIFNLPRVKY